MYSFKKFYLLPATFASMLVFSLNTYASNVSVMISGSINASTCTVNNGNAVVFDFGTIPAADISNAKYQIYKEIPVDCDYNTGIPYVKVLADTLGDLPNVVKTSTPNFGIALYQGNNLAKALQIGNGTLSAGNYYGFRIGYGLEGVGQKNGILSLTAVPYLIGNKDPDAGPFSATATLSFNYL